jgi:arylsulfatase A-like enzyme
MGSLLAVDDMMSQLVDELDASGDLANTVVLFTSDNGYLLGSHHLQQKMAPYEESLRIPLVVTGPGVRQGTEQRMVTLADVMPTVLELAGLPVPANADGRSLVPLLRGEPTSWRTDLLAEYRSVYSDDQSPETAFIADLIDVPTYQAVRTERYLYVEWFPDPTRPGYREPELYDLATDPYQLDNLIRTRSGDTVTVLLWWLLRLRLDQLRPCSGVTCR